MPVQDPVKPTQDEKDYDLKNLKKVPPRSKSDKLNDEPNNNHGENNDYDLNKLEGTEPHSDELGYDPEEDHLNNLGPRVPLEDDDEPQQQQQKPSLLDRFNDAKQTWDGANQTWDLIKKASKKVKEIFQKKEPEEKEQAGEQKTESGETEKPIEEQAEKSAPTETAEPTAETAQTAEKAGDVAENAAKEGATEAGEQATKTAATEAGEKAAVTQASEKAAAGAVVKGAAGELAGGPAGFAAAGLELEKGNIQKAVKGVAGEAASNATGEAVDIAAGATTGAGLGAMIGSIVPVVGNALGAAVGSVLGASEVVVKKHWPVIVAVIALPFIIVILVVGLIFGSMSGIAQLPTTAAQQAQAQTLAAVGGDLISQKAVTTQTIANTRTRYANIEKEAHADSIIGTSRDTQFAAVLTDVDNIEKANNANNLASIKNNLLQKVITDDKTATTGLPWGKWIAADAEKYYNNNGSPGTLNQSTFSSKTGAPVNLACASFVSSVLNEVGVPQGLVANVDGLWGNSPTPANSIYKVVITRLATGTLPTKDKVENTYIPSLQPGDIVFFGTTSERGNLFHHVAIYIGDSAHDQVGTSSAKNGGTIHQSPVDKQGNVLVLNGALRYAP